MKRLVLAVPTLLLYHSIEHHRLNVEHHRLNVALPRTKLFEYKSSGGGNIYYLLQVCIQHRTCCCISDWYYVNHWSYHLHRLCSIPQNVRWSKIAHIGYIILAKMIAVFEVLIFCGLLLGLQFTHTSRPVTGIIGKINAFFKTLCMGFMIAGSVFFFPVDSFKQTADQYDQLNQS